MSKNKNETQIIVEPDTHDLTIIREFEAPPELVFKAHTDPQLYAQWLGPHRLKTSFERFEPVSGGQWRFIQTDTGGEEYAFHGIYHEVTAPERIIGTFEFEGLPETGHVSLETAVFEALPGNRTRLTSHSVFQSIEDRDGMVQAGMETGVVEGYERLDAILEKSWKTA